VETWCDRLILQSRTIAWQCRGCRVVRFFRNVLYKPFGYDLMKWQHDELRILYGTVDQFTGLRQYRKAYESVAKQNGKLIDSNELIPTPSGWSTMGNVAVGDYVFSENGLPTRVTAKSDVVDTERAFEVCFGDGTSVIAGERHEWLAEKYSGRYGPQVFTTLQMFEQCPKNGGYKKSYFRIKQAMAVEYATSGSDLPVHPYAFGFWLGNGKSDASTVTVNRADVDMFLANMAFIGYEFTWMREQAGESNVYRIPQLRPIVVPHFSMKRIRLEYLRASIEQRWELVAGLMDSDGCISTNKGQAIYSTSVEALSRDVMELLRSLGVKATCNPVESDRYGVPNATNYRVQFTALDDMPCSKLPRKLERRWPRLKGARGLYHHITIKEVEKRPMQCIEVDNPTHLYLVGKSFVPTHNSFLVGGLPIYHIVVEVADEMMPEAFGIASATDQAKITFDAAKLFVDNNPRLKQILDVRASRLRIVRKDGRGVYRVLAAEGKTQDGKRPSLLLFDELHRFTRKGAAEVHSVLIKGQLSRKEPLMVETTTSGDEQESKLWFDEYENAQHILDGSLVNPRFHAAIWQADPKRIIKDPEYWKSREARVAANPSHEDHRGFLKDADIEENLNDALTKPEKKGSYVRLNLNVPFSMSETPAIDMAQWYEGGGGVDLREWATYDVQLLIKKWGLVDRPCIVGVDLAWSIDMTALACLFPPTDDFDNNSVDQWKVLMFYWLPEKRRKFFETRTRAPLNDWMERKFIDMVPGYEVHAKVIEDKIKWAAEMFDMRELTFDKWGGMRAIGQKLSDEEGMTAIDIRQGFATISAPTKEFLAMHMANRIAHGNNPILNWNASCLAILSDGADNIKPSKPDRTTASKRIDGCAAIITALARAMLLYKPESVYATRGPLVVE
jgi:phage terminase large subunit-like protein